MELIPATKAAAIVGTRDAALSRMAQAADLLARGHALASEAAALAREAHGDAGLREVDHARQDAFRRLFVAIDPAVSLEAFRRDLDARTWVRLVELTGIRRLMDRTEWDKLHTELSTTVPAVTEDNIAAVVEGLAGDATLIFQRGLARAFVDLDRRFKSHDGFSIGARVILSRLFDEYGHWNYHNSARATIADIERVFAVLDGAEPNGGGLVAAMDAGRSGHGPRQGSCESPYFRIHTFKNGNAHLWFTRDDLVAKANQVLADYYGEVLPDGVAATGPEADLAQSTRAISKDLAFYPTPDKVIDALLRHVHIDRDSVVLEPSAGTGAIVRRLLPTGARVTAIEVDVHRLATVEALRQGGCHGYRLEVYNANVLRWPQSPRFTHVVMNPPFFGTHWIDHIVHAFGFLRPGGELVAVVPISAELGTSRRHVKFREWAAERSEYKRLRFEDLPAESFAESGTRVNTAILRLRA